MVKKQMLTVFTILVYLFNFTSVGVAKEIEFGKLQFFDIEPLKISIPDKYDRMIPPLELPSMLKDRPEKLNMDKAPVKEPPVKKESVKELPKPTMNKEPITKKEIVKFATNTIECVAMAHVTVGAVKTLNIPAIVIVGAATIDSCTELYDKAKYFRHRRFGP